jgi:hypothetical protein
MKVPPNCNPLPFEKWNNRRKPRRIGDPIQDTIVTEEHLRRFWANVDVNPSNGCWEWRTAKKHNHYGKMSIFNIFMRANRLSLLFHGVEIPEGMMALHHCDNKPCVNPDHLYVGTRKDNIRDMIARKQRSPFRRQPIFKLDAWTVYKILGLSSRYPQSRIAAHFGVVQSLVSQIVTRKVHRHIMRPSTEEIFTLPCTTH